MHHLCIVILLAFITADSVKGLGDGQTKVDGKNNTSADDEISSQIKSSISFPGTQNGQSHNQHATVPVNDRSKQAAQFNFTSGGPANATGISSSPVNGTNNLHPITMSDGREPTYTIGGTFHYETHSGAIWTLSTYTKIAAGTATIATVTFAPLRTFFGPVPTVTFVPSLSNSTVDGQWRTIPAGAINPTPITFFQANKTPHNSATAWSILNSDFNQTYTSIINSTITRLIQSTVYRDGDFVDTAYRTTDIINGSTYTSWEING